MVSDEVFGRIAILGCDDCGTMKRFNCRQSHETEDWFQCVDCGATYAIRRVAKAKAEQPAEELTTRTPLF